MIGSLIAKFLRARWGAILPQVFKAIAEGKAGPIAQQVYWKTAGYRTFIGMALGAAGAGLLWISSSYPDAAWAAPWAQGIIALGGVLSTVGLADGGTRSPWPTTPDGKAPWQVGK